MECSNCGSPSAKLHKRLVDGAEIQMCLCSACYEKLYSKSDVSERFARLFGDSGKKAKIKKVCHYTAFRNEIENSLRYCQWSSVHSGKKMNGATEEKYELVRELVREQEYIKAQMDRAFQEDDYKLVAELKRRLQAIRKKLALAGEE